TINVGNNGSGGTSFSQFIGSNIDIEHVEVDINFTQWHDLGDLEIRLISPDGTSSILIDNSGEDNGNSSGGFGSGRWEFFSNEFRGEDTIGTWTVQIFDEDSNTISPITINDIDITFYGKAASNDDTFIFTEEYSDYDGLFGHTRSINGGIGIDTINAAAVDSNTTVNLTAGTGSIDGVAITTSGIENVISGDGNDWLSGNAGNNRLLGMRGNDSIYGYGGNDYIDGGAGNEVWLWGGAGNDTLLGGAGNDRLYETGNTNFTLTNTSLTSALTGTDSLDSIERAYLVGGTNNNVINAYSFSGTTHLLAGSGNDNIYGSATNSDYMDGGIGNDVLYGYAGNDTLIGKAGDDLLWGGVGNDTLTGGSGADDFWFTSSSHGVDTITDFAVGDMLRISNYGFNSSVAGISDLVNGITSAVNGIANLGSSVGFRYFSGSGNIYFDSDGGGFGSGNILLATLSNQPVIGTLSNSIQVV
ncbi:MAG: hypothetical protein F6K41_41180, partial [Symploca sp. SIO3E6]|nr:hypothetical protein [Caldora sp. SIO3E6]